MRFKYSMLRSFESEIKPEHYPTTDPAMMMRLDYDIMVDDAQDFFDRPDVDSSFKITQINDDGTVEDSYCG